MALKKKKLSSQSIFEYIILTVMVTFSILFFANSPYFINIKNAFNDAFDRAVLQILTGTGNIYGVYGS